ncbi:MAG: glycine betaine ABC transporter substrate-binding protein [Oscillospiraceae bacterium]|nr:glycine betaine ABC transporter substrate-binding protein [Oscillospiraceae bacterium]
MTILQVLQHIYIVFAAIMLSVLFGVLLGIVAYLSKPARPIILKISEILQTIPSLALLGIIMVFTGAGKLPAIIGITLYSLMPVVSNTYLALSETPEGVSEAARGVGMSRLQQLIKVQIPLAAPTIFTGIRIAVVSAVGTGVFAAYVGGGGLGGTITNAIRVSDIGQILLCTAVLMVIAVVLDIFFSKLEKNAKQLRKGKLYTQLGIFAVLFLLLIPIVSRSSSGITVYDGDYSETQILTHMAKMLIEDQTDLTVTIEDQMTQVNSWNCLTREEADFMISYDGTILTTFLGQDTADIPEGQSLYQYVSDELVNKHLTMTGKLGFDNTYAIAATRQTAEKYQLKKVSDLTPVAGELVFGAEQGFFTLEGSMKYGPFCDYYGLHFKDDVSVDIGLKYAAIQNGSFDVTEVYATDGLNVEAGLVILEDDLEFFPEYNGVYLIRNEVLLDYPEIEDTLNLLSGLISTEDMSQMTYEVDVNGKPVDEVAKEFLEERGLIQTN